MLLRLAIIAGIVGAVVILAFVVAWCEQRQIERQLKERQRRRRDYDDGYE